MSAGLIKLSEAKLNSNLQLLGTGISPIFENVKPVHGNALYGNYG